MTYYLPKPISSQNKRFIDASFSPVASPLSRSKAYNTAESRSCIQTAIVSSVRINIRQCTHINVTAHGDIIQNSQNVGKLSACANSGYQALFSDFSNGPGYEANIKVDCSSSTPSQISVSATVIVHCVDLCECHSYSSLCRSLRVPQL